MILRPDNDKIPFQEKNDVSLKIIGDYDKQMLNYIGRLYKDLNGDTVDIDEIENIVDVLAAYKKKSEHTYLETLIHPEQSKGCKIPTPIPVPSTSFQLHNSVTLSTNQLGNLAIVFNPFFLFNNTSMGKIIQNDYAAQGKPGYIPSYFTTFYVNNNEALTGSTANEGVWSPFNIGQGIPGVYDQYRIVSASIIVKYIGRMDITSGVIGGAIVFDEEPFIGANGNYLADDNTQIPTPVAGTWLGKYTNFDLAMDSFYHQENLCIEGLRMLYFPIDNTFEEYTRMGGSGVVSMNLIQSGGFELRMDEDYLRSGFNWMIYALGAPPSSACFKVDVYLNFECLPDARFLNYMPITPPCGHVSAVEKKESIAIVQQKPVMKSTEEVIITKKNKPNAWKQLKKAFQGALPSIGKLITKGIISAIPYMKPGLALAGTLLESASNLGNKTNQLNPNMSIDLEDVE